MKGLSTSLFDDLFSGLARLQRGPLWQRRNVPGGPLPRPRKLMSDEPFGVDLDLRALPPFASRCAEPIDVAFSRKEELQEAHAPVATGVTETEQHEIVGQAGFFHNSDRVFSVVGKPLDGVLSVVVIPGYAIMLDEGKQLIPIFQQSLTQGLRRLRAEGLPRERL